MGTFNESGINIGVFTMEEFVCYFFVYLAWLLIPAIIGFILRCMLLKTGIEAFKVYIESKHAAKEKSERFKRHYF